MSTKKIRVMVGWNNPKYNVKGLADGFDEMDDYQIIRVAADKDLPECSGKFDYHILEEMIACFPYDTGMNSKRPGYRNMTKYQIKMTQMAVSPCISFPMRLLLKKIEEEHGPIHDMIVCQCDLILDMQDVHIPWYYYFTEDYKPTLPINGNPLGVFYGYVGGKETLLRSFPYQYAHWRFCELVPYGMDKMAIPEIIPAWEIRDIDVGFKGLLHFSQHSQDAALRNIYDERRHYLQWTEHYMKSDQFQIDLKALLKEDSLIHIPTFVFETHTNFEAYVPFMLNTKIAINVQGGNGFINQRMYEALGFKCLLLQNFFPKLAEFGFIDGETCLTFSCEAELRDKILWACTHMEEAEAIAERGHQLFKDTKCSWQDRAYEMEAIIQKHAIIDVESNLYKYRQLMRKYQDEINTFADLYLHSETSYEVTTDGTVWDIDKTYNIQNTTSGNMLLIPKEPLVDFDDIILIKLEDNYD